MVLIGEVEVVGVVVVVGKVDGLSWKREPFRSWPFGRKGKLVKRRPQARAIRHLSNLDGSKKEESRNNKWISLTY